MKLNKEIECIIRAILYPESCIFLVCKDIDGIKRCSNDFQLLNKQHEILQKEISSIENAKIIFKNGSSIEAVASNKPEEVIRGKRAEIKHWLFDWEYAAINNEIFEKACKPYLNR